MTRRVLGVDCWIDFEGVLCFSFECTVGNYWVQSFFVSESPGHLCGQENIRACIKKSVKTKLVNILCWKECLIVVILLIFDLEWLYFILVHFMDTLMIKLWFFLIIQ